MIILSNIRWTIRFPQSLQTLYIGKSPIEANDKKKLIKH